MGTPAISNNTKFSDLSVYAGYGWVWCNAAFVPIQAGWGNKYASRADIMRAWVGTTGISRRSCLIYAICRDASRDYRSACILPTENRFDSRNSAAVSFRFALSILSSISFPRASFLLAWNARGQGDPSPPKSLHFEFLSLTSRKICNRVIGLSFLLSSFRHFSHFSTRI